MKTAIRCPNGRLILSVVTQVIERAHQPRNLVTGNVLDSKAVRGDKKGPPKEFGARIFAFDNH